MMVKSLRAMCILPGALVDDEVASEVDPGDSIAQDPPFCNHLAPGARVSQSARATASARSARKRSASS